MPFYQNSTSKMGNEVVGILRESVQRWQAFGERCSAPLRQRYRGILEAEVK